MKPYFMKLSRLFVKLNRPMQLVRAILPRETTRVREIRQQKYPYRSGIQSNAEPLI